MWMRKRLMTVVGLLAAILCLVGAPGSSWSGTSSLRPGLHPVLTESFGTNGTISVILRVTAEFDEADLVAMGARVTSRWPFIQSIGADLPAGSQTSLASVRGVRAVIPDSPVIATTTGLLDGGSLVNSYNETVKAPSVWGLGYDGTGVTIAVVDTGLTWGAGTDLGERVKASTSVNTLSLGHHDEYGHGSHVAGIIAGDGRNSNRAYMGIAPGASLISVKFSDALGNAHERNLLDALQWVFDNRETHKIRVVNISAVVGTRQSYRESPTAAAVEQLWLNGVVVVVAAGNRGTNVCAVCYAPASDPHVITVGAVDDLGTKRSNDDTLAEWSSRGLTLDGHHKPDVMAPGNRMVSYMPYGAIRSSYPQNAVDANYFRMGGTSMSAPVVSGVVALILQAKPDLTPDQVKWLLTNTTRPYRNQPLESPGIVDAYSAITYAGTVGQANQGLAVSPLLDGATGLIDVTNIYWSNIYWSNIYWSNVYWASNLAY